MTAVEPLFCTDQGLLELPALKYKWRETLLDHDNGGEGKVSINNKDECSCSVDVEHRTLRRGRDRAALQTRKVQRRGYNSVLVILLVVLEIHAWYMRSKETLRTCISP